jgi:DNA-binding LytR/AlgR family response regulator
VIKYNIAIVEDSEDFQKLIMLYLEKIEKETNLSFDVSSYFDGDEITHEYTAQYHIIFLDIQMKRMDGMTAAKQIREFDEDVIIIFITNMAGYAIEGYSVNAMGYLLKPLSYFAFKEEILKSIEKISLRKRNHILIPQEKGTIRLNVDNVLYIESFKHDLFIHTKEETFQIRATLKSLEAKLKNNHFYRMNNCYLVNLKWVSRIEGEICYIEGRELKISRPRRKGFMDALTAYIGNVL